MFFLNIYCVTYSLFNLFILFIYLFNVLHEYCLDTHNRTKVKRKNKKLLSLRLIKFTLRVSDNLATLARPAVHLEIQMPQDDN
jgi:hypothetical protein